MILLVDAARISNAAKSGLLQSYRSEELDKNVPVEYRDPQARWYALTRRVRVMVANPKKVDCLLYTSPSPRDGLLSRMPSSA